MTKHIVLEILYYCFLSHLICIELWARGRRLFECAGEGALSPYLQLLSLSSADRRRAAAPDSRRTPDHTTQHTTHFPELRDWLDHRQVSEP
jgi:hypothetical protein